MSSFIGYESYPPAKECLRGAVVVRAVGEVFRDVKTNAVLEVIACGFDGERFLTSAQQAGFLDIRKFGIDCWAGGISAGAGRLVTGFLGRYVNIPVPKDSNVMREIVRFDPAGKMMYIVSTDFGKTLAMPIDAGTQWMQYLTNIGYEASEGFLEELLQTGVAQWLENQVE